MVLFYLWIRFCFSRQIEFSKLNLMAVFKPVLEKKAQGVIISIPVTTETLNALLIGSYMLEN